MVTMVTTVKKIVAATVETQRDVTGYQGSVMEDVKLGGKD